MNLRSKWCLYGLLSWAAMAGIASAQQPPGSVRLRTSSAEQLPPPLTSLSEDAGQVNLGRDLGYTSVDRQFRPRFNVDTRGGGLYGYSPGYTNIGMFMPFAIEGDSAILFLDARGMVTHDGGGGANVGAGWRWWMQDIDRIVGLSAWYDYDSGHSDNYSQIGLSFESLGRYVDYRVNGYIPIGTRSHMLSSTVDPTDTVFQVNDLLFRRTNVQEQTYTGFDAEVGGPLPVIGRYGVNGYVGGYHFIGNGGRGGSFTGASGRFMAQINEDVSFGVQVTDDHVFGTNTQFQVFVTLPDGAPSRWLRNPRVQDRLTQSVFRQGRVMAHTDTFSTFDRAINPKDGLPYFVTHINPNLAAPGTGTFENPFNSIAVYNGQSVPAQQQSDIISVRARLDGTNTNLDTAPTFTLYDGQRLLSTSVQHTFMATNFPGVLLNLPDPTGIIVGEPLPMLFNSAGGDVITLAPGNVQCLEVSGFDIQGSAGGSGISGTDNSFVLINRNEIHNGFNGINLVNLTNGISPSVIDSNILRDNVNDGFHLLNIGGPSVTTLQLTNNLAYGNGDDGFDIAADAGSTVGGLIDGNSTVPPVGGTTNGDDGLSLSSIGGTLAFNTAPDQQISNNNFSNNSGDGVFVDVTAGGTADLLFLANTISSNGGAGINVPASDASLINLVIGGPDDLLNRNTITNNGGPGILLDLSNTANGLTATIENNVISGNLDGIQVNVADIASFGPGSEIFNNQITGNRRDGIRLTRSGSGNLDLGSPAAPVIHDNIISGNAENGLTLIATGDNVVPVVLSTEDNIFDSNGLDGLNITAGVFGGPIDNPNVIFDSNRDQFTTNGRHGLNLITHDESNIFTNLVNVTANGNLQNGLNTVTNEGNPALATGQFINILSPTDPLYNGTSTFSNNGGDGISNTANHNSLTVININPLNENQTILNSNFDDGWNLNRFDAALIIATAQNASFSNNGSDGIEFNYNGSPPTDPNQPLSGTPNLLTLNNIVADANGNNGLFTHGAGDSVLLANITTSQFTNNAFNGILIQTDLGSSFGESALSRSTFDNLTVTGNAADGIHIDENSFLVTGSNVFLEVNTNSGNTDISSNGDDGIHIDTAGLITDILIHSTNGNLLTINDNGANGVRWDITDSLLGDNHQVDIGNFLVPGNGVTIDNNSGDGIQFNVPVGSGLLLVTDSTITNSGDDGININMTALGNVNGNSVGFGTVQADNNVIDANNAHGINIQVEGGDTDTSATPLVFAAFTNSQITNNGLNGANIELRGSTGGTRSPNFGPGVPNAFFFDGNRIALNGQRGVVNQSHGIFYLANAGDISRFDGTTHRRVPPVGGFDDGQNAGTSINIFAIAPFIPDFNTGNNNPTFFNMSNFMNLRAETVATLQVTNNIIEFNGPIAAAAGEGVFLNISTLAYLSADVSSNTFTGNGSSDFRTRSFIATDAAGNPIIPPATTQGATPGPNDVVFLDDTAQLDLLLSNNTGQNIQPVGPGALYPGDPLKQNGIVRNVQIFQVDDTAGGLATNNWSNIPVSQQTLFLNAGYWTTQVTPWSLNNPAFPQDFNTSPGDPFLP